MPGLRGHGGDTRLQVNLISRVRFSVAICTLASGFLLAGLAGCHRTPGPDVVATVNGKPIYRADLEKYYEANLGDAPQKLTPDEANIRRLAILHQMIEDEILQQRAAKLNLAATDEDVNAKLTEIKAPYTQEEFEKQLKQRNMTLDDLKRDLRRSLTTTKLLNAEIESKINITDAEIRAYYEAHKAEFDLIEPQYHLARIIVTTTPASQTGNLQNNKAASAADAKKKIQILYNRLQSGEDFSTLAMNFSEDPNTASNGGDMGFISESALKSDPDVYNAISKLKPGEITGILPTYRGNGPGRQIIGYAIYKLIVREPAGQRQLSDPNVQQVIHQTLHESKKQLLQNAYLEKLHDEAKVHNYFADEILKQASK